jgi:hypothetical protein
VVHYSLGILTKSILREKDRQELFVQRARQVDFYKYEKGRQGEEEGAEARSREAQKKREERVRLEATRREAIFGRMRLATLDSRPLLLAAWAYLL